MIKARAIIVGLVSVDPNEYQWNGNPWDGRDGCWGCELDAHNIEDIVKSLGYNSTTLLTEKATAGKILQELHKASNELKSGDFLVFYFSGHGGQTYDSDGDEWDGQDETLVCYNREIVDDELNEIWVTFKEGVRIIMISDSCNSETNHKSWPPKIPKKPILIDEKNIDMKAQMIHFGGCRDGKTSDGYNSGGAFTLSLCHIWNKGNFKGTYRSFHGEIVKEVEKLGKQKPQYRKYGNVSKDFENRKPFTFI